MPSICAKASLLNLIKSWFAAVASFLVLCSSLVTLFSGCSDRPRLNPLDPKNPNTLGRPTGLNVISMRDTVMLRWDRLDLRDLSGFQIYRQLQGDPGFSPIAQTPPGIYSYRDVRAKFDTMHSYRISALAPDFESPLSNAVTITPGPTFSWVADGRSGDLIKLTHDGTHEILRSGAFPSSFRLQIDAQRGYIWVLEEFRGSELGRLDINGRNVRRFESIGGPADLAVNQSDGSVWVADTLTNGLMKFNSDGTRAIKNEAYKRIVALAVHPQTHEVWVLSRDSQRVLIFSPTGELRRQASDSLQRPRDIDIDGRTGKVWVADGTHVIRLDAEGNQETLSPQTFRFVYRLSADEVSGGCWLIDYSTSFRDSRLVKLAPDGALSFPEILGFDRPESLAANPYDGSCLVADYGNDRLVRVSADGQSLSAYGRISLPVEVETSL
jgi:DNA-binding beta-propeller fold protein YncE